MASNRNTARKPVADIEADVLKAKAIGAPEIEEPKAETTGHPDVEIAKAKKAEQNADYESRLKAAAGLAKWSEAEMKTAFVPTIPDIDAAIVKACPTIMQRARNTDISLFGELSILCAHIALKVRGEMRQDGKNDLSPAKLLPAVRDKLYVALMYGYVEDDKGKVTKQAVRPQDKLPTLDNYVPLAAKAGCLAADGYLRLTPWNSRLDRALAAGEARSDGVVDILTYSWGLVAKTEIDHALTVATKQRQVATLSRPHVQLRASAEMIRQIWAVKIAGPILEDQSKRPWFDEFGTYTTKAVKRADATSVKIGQDGVVDLPRMTQVLEHEARDGEGEVGTVDGKTRNLILGGAKAVVHNTDFERDSTSREAFFALAFEVHRVLENEPLNAEYTRYIKALASIVKAA